MFEEIEKIVNEISDKSGDEIINIIRERQNKMVHFIDFYNVLIEKLAVDINERIKIFISRGTIKNQFFMIETSDTFDYDENFFRNKFFLKNKHVPFYLCEGKLVLECGLYNRLITIIKSASVSNKRLSTEEINPEPMKSEMCPENLCHTNDNDNKSTYGLPSDYILRSHRYYYSILNGLCLEYFKIEWMCIKNYIFMMDNGFFTDIFNEIDGNLLENCKANIVKINRAVNKQNFTFYLSRNSVITVISKILNLEINYDFDEELCIMDGLSISYKPNSIFMLFFSQKNINELELIFRVLFTPYIINYGLSKREPNMLTNLIRIMNNNLVSSFYMNSILKRLMSINADDLNTFISDVDKITKSALRDLYITSYNIFKILSSYFILCFKYIKYGTGDVAQLKQIIIDLSRSIDNENHNMYLANALYKMKMAIITV